MGAQFEEGELRSPLGAFAITPLSYGYVTAVVFQGLSPGQLHGCGVQIQTAGRTRSS